MRKLYLMAVAATALTAAAPAARAAPVFSNPTSFPLLDLGTGDGTGTKQAVASPIAIAPGETASFTGLSGVYSGNQPLVDRSPFGSSPRNYLAAEPLGTLTLSFATPQTSLSLLWGSIDGYNGLLFQAGGQTITGTQILAAFPSFTPGSSNEYITISGLDPFTSVNVTSLVSAFEFNPAAPIPEPSVVALLGAGLLGLAFLKRPSRS